MNIIEELTSLVTKLLQRYDVPGAAVAVVNNGTVAWTLGFGLADVENRVPVSAETVFQVASISKAVTAWGILRLVERGALDLDAPVERYLTRWHLPPSRYDHSTVTIRRLLSHTAGTSIRGVKEFGPDASLPRLEDHLSDAGRDGPVQVVQAPGTVFRYSGGGYTILQLVVEEVAGASFAAFMQKEVLQPLGMERSCFEWRPALHPATAAAYDREGRRVPNFLYTAQAAAGLYTTAADLAAFAAAGLRGPNGEPAGRGVLPARTIDAMYRPLTEPGETPDTWYGLGYMIKMLAPNVRVIGHTGDNRGWKARFAAVPATASAVVALTNSENGWPVHGDIYRLWLKEVAGIDEPVKFAAATILGGRVLPSGIPDTERPLRERFDWRTECEIDRDAALRAGRGKITTWRELKATLQGTVTGHEAQSVWIHEDLLDVGWNEIGGEMVERPDPNSGPN